MGRHSPAAVGQAAKYLPGGLWPIVGRAGLARRLGVPLRVAGASLVMEALLIVAAAALLAPLVLAAAGAPAWAGPAAVAALALAALAATRAGVAIRAARAVLARAAGGTAPAIRLRPARRALALYVAAWAVTGLALWLTARALYAVPLADAPLYAGAYAVAWTAGFAVVFAPGGLGVREVVLVALLRGRIGETQALLLAATSRLMFTAADAAAAGLALPWLRRALRGTRAAAGRAAA